jgi:hypothetical protein
VIHLRVFTPDNPQEQPYLIPLINLTVRAGIGITRYAAGTGYFFDQFFVKKYNGRIKGNRPWMTGCFGRQVAT